MRKKTALRPYWGRKTSFRGTTRIRLTAHFGRHKPANAINGATRRTLLRQSGSGGSSRGKALHRRQTASSTPSSLMPHRDVRQLDHSFFL